MAVGSSLEAFVGQRYRSQCEEMKCSGERVMDQSVRMQRDNPLHHRMGPESRKTMEENFEETPLIVAVITYIGYGILVVFGYLRDFLRYRGLEKTKAAKERGNEVRYYDLFAVRPSFVTMITDLPVSAASQPCIRDVS